VLATLVLLLFPPHSNRTNSPNDSHAGGGGGGGGADSSPHSIAVGEIASISTTPPAHYGGAEDRSIYVNDCTHV